ncbi:TrmH family RNA methyltransferase [Breznakiella homolactica]|uniref:TrmH family RNA methyltransferase n=2 Tax=Breznakiella homolactica TaxID=2798577 RepID=A0A7T8BCD4_9SPIR|nr:TrmH family RNA methyltransferase [Breznakiella homolactica]
MEISRPENGFAADVPYLTAVLRLLAEDTGFSGASAAALSSAWEAFRLAESPVSELSRGELLRRLNGTRHILLAEIGKHPADWDFIDHGGRLDQSQRRVFPGVAVYLEDIRSPFNVGAMFRTAESFGAETLLLSPLCADPGHPRAERTAMGCIAVLPWERVPLEELPGPVFALETGGTPLADFNFPLRGTAIVGSEELGVSPGALALADQSLGRVSIPVYGAKGSLNAGVAFGIVMQAWAFSLSQRRS